MNFFNAFGKRVLRDFSDIKLKSDKSKSSAIAYKKTSKEIAKAKKTGQWIDGSSTYHKNKTQLTKKAYKNHKRFNQFIDDL